eukprot:Hpha_TRINITY_DN16247_c0_g1::TRINITY_DN16247_c0_g1_i1::g.15423::m.15423
MRFLIAVGAFAGMCGALPFTLTDSEPTTGLCTPPAAAEGCDVAKSGSSELLRLVRTPAAGGTGVMVARSYDGHDWEGVNPDPLTFSGCTDTACTFWWDPTAYTYTLKKTVVTAPAGTKHATARLFNQGTFGATDADINSFNTAGGGDATAAGAWFDAQVAKQATLARSYQRTRMNPRFGPNMAGDVFGPCDVGSRWHSYAFTRGDVGTTLTVADGGAGVYTLSVHGQKLTEVQASEWTGAPGTYEVCHVYEVVGADVTVAAPGSCGATQTKEKNPIIAFADPLAAGILLLQASGGDPSFATLPGVMSTVIMQSYANPSGCPAAHSFSLEWLYFLSQGGSFYRYDARLKLLKNTEGEPTTANAAGVSPGNLCPANGVSPLSPGQTCTRGSPCGSAGVTCGSRGEVANDPNKGNRYIFSPYDSQKTVHDAMAELDYHYQIHNGKQLPFHNIAVFGDDQLRQRVTWALFQMVPISEDLGSTRLTEAWGQYMDIFAEHAFGNYRDVLQEVASNPLMAKYLSFQNNKAFAADGKLPDQNFAREVMQLFTIGLWKQNMDGTEMRDASGQSIPTYNNKDIVTFSRAWTGFTYVQGRGNIESVHGGARVDPMRIIGSDRDRFPKTDLSNGYIGDGYPLCADLPPQHFLKAGARYVYSGTNSVEGHDYDHRGLNSYQFLGPPTGTVLKLSGTAGCNGWTYCGGQGNTHLARFRVRVESTTTSTASAFTPEVWLHGDNGNRLKVYKVAHFAHGGAWMYWYPLASNFPSMTPADYTALRNEFNALFPIGTTITVHNSKVVGQHPPSLPQYTAPSTSGLYGALCSDAGSGCTLPPVVTLGANLACEASDEACGNADDLTTVKVVASGVAHYYTYVRHACTKFAVFEGRRTVRKHSPHSDETQTAQCSDPTVPVAGAVCCVANQYGVATSPLRAFKPPQCNILGERMTHASAAARCAAAGAQLCTGDIKGGVGLSWEESCGYQQYSWFDDTCAVQVQVKADGLVSLVSSVDDTGLFVASTNNEFYPVWANGAFPTEPAPAGCATQTDGTLLCTASVWQAALFSARPSRADAEAQLRVGALDPAAWDGAYACAAGVDCNTDDVVLYVQAGVIDATSIIGLRRGAAHGGGYAYYMNKVSTVSVGGFSFRNAPTFMRLVGEGLAGNPQIGHGNLLDQYTAAAETGALLDHLFLHSSTAPFIARNLIQRLVTSNPSPRYVEVVATAFATGNYGGRGSGRYGCLKATVAAVLLDREARSSTLEADPSYGGVQEPFIKLLRVLRSLDYQSVMGQELTMLDLISKIGQDVFRAPSVFGFYLPDFQPHGVVADAGLVSPESELLIAPRIFGFLNGLSELVHNGLQHCNGGFGQSRVSITSQSRMNCAPDGTLQWTSGHGAVFPDAVIAGEIVDKLDLLLTGGRLSAESKAAVLAGLPQYVSPFDVDPLACSPGFHVEEHCEISNQASCTVGDLCRKDDGSGNWAPPRGCIRVSGRPYAAMASDSSLPCCSAPDINSALPGLTKIAIELMLTTPEFHTTGLRAPGAPRPVPSPPVPALNQGYKAVVVVLMNGGADSFNHLIPGDAASCTAPLSFEQYQSVRGNAALNRASLLSIAADETQQPCSQFLVNPDLSNVHAAFQAGDAAFFANIGNLVEPVTKETLKTSQLPPHLFAHNMQQRHMQTVHSQAGSKVNGILGKMADALAGTATTNVYAFDKFFKATEADTATAVVLDKNTGVNKLDMYAAHSSAIDALAGASARSHFAENYAQILQHSLGVTTDLAGKLEAQGGVGTSFPTSAVGRQFDVAAQVIKLRDASGNRLSDRDVFAVHAGGFDTHGSFSTENVASVDAAIGAFKAEMVAQGVWQDVVVVAVSDFGRALTPNGEGTDHAWGGNYFAVGGSVRDQAMLSRYPDTLEAGHSLDYGHGILIPNAGYETVWGPVIDWFGVPQSKWDDVLPNRGNFAVTSKADLFDA